MAQDFDIFVATDLGLDAFARQAEAALGLGFARCDGDDGPFFHHRSEGRDIMLLRHDLEDDGDLAFSRYPFQASVRAADHDPPGRETADRRLALWVLERFAAQGLRPAMAVEGLQLGLATA